MNQDKFILKAVESTGCSGCFFNDNEDLTDDSCDFDLRYKYFPCTPNNREDGREVIWVIDKDQGEQDETSGE